MLNKIKSIRGFTLVELLVVISIIGILAATIGVNYSNAKKTARDAKRKADIESIAAGAELYYSQYKEYPDNIDAIIAAKYLTTEPLDPQTKSRYTYITDNSASHKVFIVYDQLEISKEITLQGISTNPTSTTINSSQVNIGAGSGSYSFGGKTYYRVVGR